MSVYLGSGVGNVPRLTFSPLTPAGPTGPGGPYMIKAMCDAQHLPVPCWGPVSRPVISPAMGSTSHLVLFSELLPTQAHLPNCQLALSLQNHPEGKAENTRSK